MMFRHADQQQQQQRFRCPGCGRTSDTNIFLPDSVGVIACPACGLTAEEGQRKLNDELSAMFSQGMRLSSGDVPESVISSATITAIGGGGSGGGGGGSSGGMLSAGPTSTGAPSALGYNISQHYHHSSHAGLPRPNSAPGFVEGTGASGGSGAGSGAGNGSGNAGDAAREDMEMDGTMPTETEPYMRSGYEYLAERDYNRQAPEQTERERVHATDPAFSSKEWWRDFHPIEFQYGVYQQMRDRENEAPTHQEDEQMRMW